ncbi:putative lipid-transfer protein DIR1 [Actinidia eriantha]|uniref:putative lipid-transfer protein DIR1 n=1 Tax=Actinidia eriantha TaxID=165200 RepID=UPI00258A3EFA|nr:putative lipid-transfer protein DIR1 [Actinidia eriantha]
MARKKIGAMAVAALIVVTLMAGLDALVLCDMDDDGLMACKPAVTKPNPEAPSPPCCEALSGANLTCLCGYRNSFMLPSLGIDPDLAMALPAKCNLTPPPNC